ncbi:GldG family protein [Nostoc parmelioides]|uniref:Gldg family protein n=1 Tax=Nostoc parmelioides FACHB-3921 TaxID=2692909 RepID=A0ABR8BG18_9NOSO|nr:Gldg family protein [Nostoc parmelioides]MBD2252798.1 Gldg family protein [Nostoc parmelioides FACHB-3921]
MKIIKQKQLWKYLFWLGPFLIVAGLTSGLVSDTWGTITLALLISGIIIVGLWLAWQSQRSQWWKRRSTQAGTNAIAAILAVLVILGLINFLGSRYQVRADLTESQLFTLSPQSQQLVQNLQQPVKVWVFDVTQNPQDQQILENYRRKSSNFDFEYINPQTRPGLAEKFGVKNYGDYGQVFIESGNRRQLVQTLSVNERLSEIRLTNRLQQIISDRTAKVYFLQGHGEHPIAEGEGTISQAVQALGDKNYNSSPLNLVENAKVPDDADVVILAGPKRGLFDAEVKALQDYLNRGGNALLMIDPSTNPNINSLLQEWGVRLDDRLAVDVSGTGAQLGPAAPIVTDYGQHPITKDFGNNISFYPLARPLEITPVAGVESTPLLKTKAYPNSWAESDLENENLQFNPEKDLKGPLTLGVALTRKLPASSSPIPSPSPTTTPASPTPTSSPTNQTQASLIPSPSPTTTPASPTPTSSPTNQTQASPIPSPSPTTTPASPTPTSSPTNQSQASPIPSPSPTTTTPPSEEKPEKPATESRLVVIGNSEFVTNTIFQQQLNGDVFLNSVTWLSQQDQQPLSIRPKEPKNRRMNLSTSQANLLTLSSLFVLPLLGLVTAAIIWWKRR